MRNTMRTVGKICFFGLVMVASAFAQRLQSSPSPAVAGPAFDLSAGYTYLSMPIPSAGRVNFNGVDFSGNIGLSSRWGATLDSSYLYTSDVLSTKHQGYVASLRSGPVFYPVAHGNTRVFVHALAGAALVDGAVPISENQGFHGWLLRPSYAVGGGVEHAVSGQLAVRVIGDYVRTEFYDSAGGVQPQNNLQLTVNFVFRLKEHPRKSSTQLW
jgi:opacity protein-like surface antigen